MRKWLCTLEVALCLVSGPVIAAESVELSSKTNWICEGDTQVRLDDETGKLRIISKTAKVDQTLAFYACHSSHCGWGTGTECYEAPCAEMLAGPKDQGLSINLGGFVSSCTAEKSKEMQD